MNRKTIQQTISLIIFLMIFSNSLFAQNTLNYTEPDLHYRNGIEFFEKNNFAAAHNEFDLYLQRPSVLLQDNDFLKSDASYHNVLCALYLTYPETHLFI